MRTYCAVPFRIGCSFVFRKGDLIKTSLGRPGADPVKREKYACKSAGFPL